MKNIQWDYFYNPSAPYLEIAIGTVVIFCIIVFYTRLFGLKSFSKMTIVDFANTVAIGSLLASSIVNGSPSLLTGAFAIFMVFLIRIIFSIIRQRSKSFEVLTSNEPVFLLYDGVIIEENLKTCNVTHDELRAKLRKSGVLNREEVKAVVFETTGDVHILKKSDNVELDPYIFKGVKPI
ncbi:DUF421 domain-containing protein [Weeksellaceae bacterium TAE3-ERU29]|nr:DUF421 domain-containing protein [Weeksellaceae bacterium TAE3-ERU29]